MASPYQDGTQSASAISSKDVQILKEEIHIELDSAFQTAQYTITYTVQSERSGVQIPLLFLAMYYKDSFKIWCDQMPLNLEDIPNDYLEMDTSLAQDFSPYFVRDSTRKRLHWQTIYWYDENWGNTYDAHDLKFFRARLNGEVQEIKISYTARVWEDNSGWIKANSFKYALFPAQHWDSFGGLVLSITKPHSDMQLAYNFRDPDHQLSQLDLQWSFDSLPVNIMNITLIHPPNQWANFLIWLHPSRLAAIIGACFVLLHLWLIRKTMKQAKYKQSKVVAWVGLFLLPLIYLLVYVYAYDWIDGLLGANAGRMHGYTGLHLLMYPVYLIGYALVVWLFFRYNHRKVRSTHPF